MSVFSWYNCSGDIVKKCAFLFLLLFIICSCDSKTNKDDEPVSNQLMKVNDSFDAIYFDDSYVYELDDGGIYEQKLPIINYQTNDAKNVNLELKSKISINNKKISKVDGVVTNGLLDDFEIIDGIRYVTLIGKEYYYNGEKNVSDLYVFVFDKKNMNLINNDDLLNLYNLSIDDLYDKILEGFGEEADYSLMLIKNTGYYLYIDGEDLVLLFLMNNDEDVEIKKMVITG